MAFSGTKTNCVVDTAYDPDALVMDSTTNFLASALSKYPELSSSYLFQILSIHTFKT